MTTGRSRSCTAAEVAIEIVPLQLDGREIPMAVQAGLAQGHDSRAVRQGHDLVPVAGLGFRRRVGMNAHGGEDLRVRLRKRTATARLESAVTPTQTIVSTPDSRGRSTTAWRSASNSCWPRCAWVSMKAMVASGKW